MTRFVPVTVLVVLLAGTRLAGAQMTTGTLPNNATLVYEHRKIFDPSTKDYVEPQAGSKELLHYFDLAHCNCARAQTAADGPGTFIYHVREMGNSLLHVGVDFWAGTSCEDAAHRTGGSTPTCIKIDSTPDLEASFSPGGVDKKFNLYQVVNATTTGPCQQLDNANNSIFALVDTKAGATNYDYSSPQLVGGLPGETGTASGVDTKPPPPLPNATAHGNEGQINLTWSTPTANSTDIAYYQALCSDADGNAVRTSPDAAQYVTTAITCPGVNTSTDAGAEVPTPVGLDNGDKPAQPSAALMALDPKFICATVGSGTATSLTINHLTNGTPYTVVLVASDIHGNFVATYFDHMITPHLVTDFWEDLHDKGGQAEGGLCLLAETYGNDSPLTQALRGFRDDTLGSSRIGRWLADAYYASLGRLGAVVHGSIALRIVSAAVLAPLVAVALLWHWLGLPLVLALFAVWWLHRNRRLAARRARAWAALRLPSVAAVTLVVFAGLGGGRAYAGGYQPYWENGEIDDKAKAEVPVGDPSLIEWRAGLRLGPFVPDVDSQSTSTPGPYAQMFGGYHMLTMLDVDRILWTGFGQLGVGVSLGYWQKTARPFVMGSDPNAVDRPRESGNKNAFRIIPTELSAIYRLTMLDDNYGIPIVPYVRGGLAYYIWWITAPNGNYARICDDNGVNCGNKALGASLGLQGAIGLSIRAERIDASAAMSMQNSGIQHAGVYGELSVAKVNGFGSDSKLSVGDTTWFAGVDFEF
jgi:hypothetical protein